MSPTSIQSVCAPRKIIRGVFFFVCLCSVLNLWAPSASAIVIPFSGFSSDGHPVSGSAEFTLNAAADTVSLKLTNTTETTLDAGELFTGIDFSIDGLTPMLTSKTAVERTVDDLGGYVDSGGPVDISWSLIPMGGGDFHFQINFNPDAMHAVIGPPSGGNYSAANSSIKDNNGHNPFAAEMAVFELKVENLEENSPVEVKTFRFGTGLDPAVPEPATWVLVMLGVALVPWRRR